MSAALLPFLEVNETRLLLKTALEASSKRRRRKRRAKKSQYPGLPLLRRTLRPTDPKS